MTREEELQMKEKLISEFKSLRIGSGEDAAIDRCRAEILADLAWPHIEEALKKARSEKPADLNDLYQFEAGQKDGEITGWNAGLDEAIEILEAEIGFAPQGAYKELIDKFRGAKK